MSEVGPLDLSNADLKGFDPLDAGRYDAEVFELSWDAVKNTDGTGKVPAGTPMLKAQLRVLNPIIDGEPVDQDRRVFTQFVIPPKNYDKKKAGVMQGMVARFFIALGFTEEQVKSTKFDPDFEDCKGRRCVVVLSKVEYPPESGTFQNNVKGVKPAGASVGAGGGLL